MNSTHNRDIALDIGKGICLILVIFEHCKWIMPYIDINLIGATYHMPFFFIAAGFMHHDKNLSLVIHKGINRLIIPALIGTLMCSIIALAMGNITNCINWFKSLLFPGGTRPDGFFWTCWPHNGVFWFLYALFWCRVLYTILDKYCHKFVLLICALLSIFSMIQSRIFFFPFCWLEALSGIFFYSFGYYAQNHQKIFTAPIPYYLWLIFIPIWVVCSQIFRFRMWQFEYGKFYYPVGVTISCIVCIGLYRLCKHVSISKCIFSKFIVIITSKVGIYSLIFLVCHEIIREIRNELLILYPDTFTPYHKLFLFFGSFVLGIIYIIMKQYIVKQIRYKV